MCGIVPRNVYRLKCCMHLLAHVWPVKNVLICKTAGMCSTWSHVQHGKVTLAACGHMWSMVKSHLQHGKVTCGAWWGHTCSMWGHMWSMVRSQSFSLQLVLFLCNLRNVHVSFSWNNGYILISALEFCNCPSKDTPKIEWKDDPFALRLAAIQLCTIVA